ncbi:unnamed protein product [Phytophthora fragariaefolia]|uniref:Unnamed protein product n=1 Tax=Phytophthora fragariaefolia TaxID=1490495 RepID=A0A9W6YAC5_9STRA|nr:unnamed protein product [Phytophthora fragariaefolia]
MNRGSRSWRINEGAPKRLNTHSSKALATSRAPVSLIALTMTNPVKWSWNSESAVLPRRVTGNGITKSIETI